MTRIDDIRIIEFSTYRHEIILSMKGGCSNNALMSQLRSEKIYITNYFLNRTQFKAFGLELSRVIEEKNLRRS